MRSTMLRRWLRARRQVIRTIALLKPLQLGLCILVIPALAAGQSLADTARKERERREAREAAGKSTPTVTEADLASAKGQLANAPASIPEQDGTTQSQGEDDATTPEAPADNDSERLARESAEEHWRARVGQAKDRVERADRRYRRLDRMIRIGQPAQYDENGKRVMYSQRSLKRMADEAQAKLEQATEALEEARQEGRRAGALPGWLR